MTEKFSQGQTEHETAQSVVDKLVKVVHAGGNNAHSALVELSYMALGGSHYAEKAVNDLDSEIYSGVLVLPPEQQDKKHENSHLWRNVQFIIRHPIKAARIMRLQALVLLEYAAPPTNSTFEQFPCLPLSEADSIIKLSQPKK